MMASPWFPILVLVLCFLVIPYCVLWIRDACEARQQRRRR